ncbi:MAG: transcription termination factor NusA [Acidobacteriota bacterium]
MAEKGTTMSHTDLIQAIEDITRERGIDREIIIKALEEAFAAAARKVLHTRENIAAVFDEKSGEFRIYAKRRVVPEVTDELTEISLEEALEIDPQADFDQDLLFPREVPELGRIAAQAAKQVIYQKVKEAEREKIYNEYIDRVGELVNGFVKRIERGDIIVDMGSTEAVVPRREQVRSEHYNPGDRIRAIIVDVERSGKGPQIILSRTDPRLVMKLFEMEVPEIYDGTVRIVCVARDAGERSKIAVQSRDRDVDPVGACVGMKGNRVQSVIRELRGEKIDIVQYHEDSMTFVREALKPATANRVASRDEERRQVEVIVPDDQLSLAIGRRGQNVRLAGRLVGWRIDVKSESEKRAEIDAEQEARARARNLFSRLQIDDAVVEALIEAGFRDLEQLLSADLEDLTRVPGIDVELCLQIHDQAEQLIDVVRAEEEEARRVAAELAAASEARLAEEQAVAQMASTLLGESQAPDVDAAELLAEPAEPPAEPVAGEQEPDDAEPESSGAQQE